MSMISINKGDTLGKLVSTYNRQHGTKLTVDDVARANGLSDPNKIRAGTKLIFPDKFELNAKQQVIRNGQNDKMVRNGVKEQVEIKASPDELITTTPAQLSTQIQLRPLLPLPVAPMQVDRSNVDEIRRQRLQILQ